MLFSETHLCFNKKQEIKILSFNRKKEKNKYKPSLIDGEYGYITPKY